jgi:TP901 family phage tail tape measure protein
MATRPTVEIEARLKLDKTRAAGELQDSIGGLLRNVQNFNKNPIVAKNFTQPLGRITGATDEFTKSLEASNARVLAFGASAGAIYALQRAMSLLVTTTIEVEQVFTNIRALTNSSQRDFKKLQDGLFNIAKSTGLAFKDVGESAEEFARQGLAVEGTLKRTNAALTLSKLGAMDAVNATESLTAALNTFNKAGLDEITIVNKLAQVDAKFAVSSADLAEAIKRTGAAATGANVSFEELISAVTVAQERTARGGAVIGNSFKTIFTRIQRPEVLKQLQAIGVNVKDANGEIQPAINILKQYARIYDTLTPSLKANTAEQLAGVFQVNVLKAVLPELARETGKFEQALKVANETTSEASERLKLLKSTTKGTLNETVVSLQQTASEIGNLTIKPVVDNILKSLTGLSDVISPDKFFGLGENVGRGVYEGIGKVISGPGLILLGTVLGKIGVNLFKFLSESSASFLGLNREAQKQAQIQNVIQNILAQRPKDVERILNQEITLNDAAKIFNKELIRSERHYENLINLSTKLAANQNILKRTATGRGGFGTNAEGLIPNFVPNFAADADMERKAAKRGGYQSGSVRRMNVDGVGRVTYNGNEEVKRFSGLEQPAIMPPALSLAGKQYRQTFKQRLGFDPYNQKALGFVPNFSNMLIAPSQYTDDDVRVAIDGGLLSKDAQNFARGKSVADISAGLKDSKIRGNSGLKNVRDEFVKIGKASSGKVFREQKVIKDNPENHVVNVDRSLGVLSMTRKDGTINPKMGLRQIAPLKKYIDNNKALRNDSVQFAGIDVKHLGTGFGDAASQADEFSKQISIQLAEPLAGLAATFASTILGNNAIGKKKDKLAQAISGKSFISPSMEGEIFEQVARLITTSPTLLKESFNTSTNFKAPFDFEERGMATKKFARTFNFDPNRLLKADAKKTADKKTIGSIIKKAFSQAILDPDDLGARFTSQSGDLSLPLLGRGVRGFKLSGADRAEAKKKAQESFTNASGFVPNFSMDAISSAIQREDRAGVRRDKIRVGYDSRLKKSGGIGVFNTDEGSLATAIDMHLASGRNMTSLQSQGRASGHVPNFATRLSKELKKRGFVVGRGEMQPNVLEASGLTSAGKGGGFSSAAPALEELTEAVSVASTSIGSFGAEMKVINEAINPASKSISKSATQASQTLDKNSKSTKENTERSLGNTIALTLVGGQISTFGARVAESENTLISLGGSIAEAAGDVATFAPAIETSLDIVGVKGQNLGEQFSTITEKLGGTSLSLAGLTVAAQKASASLLFGGAGKFAGRGALGGGKLGVLGSARLTGRAFKRGGLKGVAKATGGRGLIGGAASLGPAGLAIGAVAGAGFIANKIQARNREKEFKTLQDSIKKSTDKFASLKEALGDLSAASSKYTEALGKNNKAKADAARQEIKEAIGKSDIGGFFRARGTQTLSSGRQVSNTKDVFGTLTDPRASADDKQEISQLLSEYTTEQETLNSNVSALRMLTGEFTSKQRSLWLSGTASQETLNKATLALGDIVGNVSSDELPEVEKALSVLRGKIIGAEAGFGVSEGELRKVISSLKAVNNETIKDASKRKLFNASLDQLINVNGLDEEAALKIVKELTDGLLPSVKARIKANKNVTDIDKKLIDERKKAVNLEEQARKRGRELARKITDFDIRLRSVNRILEITEKGEEDRAKIILNSATKINSQLISEFSNLVTQQQADLSLTGQEAVSQLNNLERKSLETLTGTLKKFSDERVAAFSASGRGEERANIDLATAFGNFNQAATGIVGAQGQTANNAIALLKDEIAKLRNLPNQQSESIQETVENLESTLLAQERENTQARKELIAKTDEQIRTQKEQLKAQLEELKVTQALRFGGDGAFSPEKFAQDFANAQADIIKGQFTGNRDLQTQGQLNILRSFKDLQITNRAGTLGNIGKPAIDSLAQQIEENLRFAIRGAGLREESFSGVKISGVEGRGISAIARARALNVTRPDQNPVLPKIDDFKDLVKEGLVTVSSQLVELNKKFEISEGGIKVSESNEKFINAVLRKQGGGDDDERKEDVNILEKNMAEMEKNRARREELIAEARKNDPVASTPEQVARALNFEQGVEYKALLDELKRLREESIGIGQRAEARKKATEALVEFEDQRKAALALEKLEKATNSVREKFNLFGDKLTKTVTDVFNTIAQETALGGELRKNSRANFVQSEGLRAFQQAGVFERGPIFASGGPLGSILRMLGIGGTGKSNAKTGETQRANLFASEVPSLFEEAAQTIKKFVDGGENQEAAFNNLVSASQSLQESFVSGAIDVNQLQIGLRELRNSLQRLSEDSRLSPSEASSNAQERLRGAIENSRGSNILNLPTGGFFDRMFGKGAVSAENNKDLRQVFDAEAQKLQNTSANQDTLAALENVGTLSTKANEAVDIVRQNLGSAKAKATGDLLVTEFKKITKDGKITIQEIKEFTDFAKKKSVGATLQSQFDSVRANVIGTNEAIKRGGELAGTLQETFDIIAKYEGLDQAKQKSAELREFYKTIIADGIITIEEITEFSDRAKNLSLPAELKGQFDQTRSETLGRSETIKRGGQLVSDLQQTFDIVAKYEGIDQAKAKSEELRGFYQQIIADSKITQDELITFNKQASAARAGATRSAFDRGEIGTQALQADVNERLAKTYDEANYSASEFSETLSEAFGSKFKYNTYQARENLSDLVKSSADTFKSGVKGAFSEAIKGTSDLREAFKNVFDAVLNNITEKATSNFVDAAFGAIQNKYGKKDGGLIQKFARGGMVAGGSGVKDDVPAFLQSGEFVIRKSSVNKYGSDFLDTINRGGISQFQDGGRAFKETLRNEFVYGGDNVKRPTSGRLERDSRLSAFAITDSNNPMGQMATERQQLFDQYQIELAAYEEQKKAAMRAFKKQQKSTIVQGFVNMGLSMAAGALAEGAGPSAKGKAGAPGNTDLNIRNANVTAATAAEGGLIKAFARGGMNRDNVPALLMGGEYVVNKQSVDKYGVNFFDGINKGRLPKFQDGGAVGMAESAGTDAPLNNTNNFSININIDQSGTASTSNDPTDQGSSQNTQAAEEEQERNKKLGERIQTVVQAELVDQLRPGGLLYSDKRI